MSSGKVIEQLTNSSCILFFSFKAPTIENLRAVGTIDYVLLESGLQATGLFAVGTASGTITCDGESECQFRTLADAQAFCSLATTCTTIHQHPRVVGDASNTRDYLCAAGKGCFSPRLGAATNFDSNWAAKGGVSYGKIDVGGTILASVSESATDSTKIITIKSNDPDGFSDPNTFVIKSGNENGIFRLGESNGNLIVVDSSLLTYQGNAVPQRLTVEVEDAGGLSVQFDVMVEVMDANEAPYFRTFVLSDKDSTVCNAIRWVSEDARVGDFVGAALEVIDSDTDDAHKWTVIGTNSAAENAFTFLADGSGQLVLRGTGSNVLDYEFESKQLLTISVEDNGNEAITVRGTVQIYILDENEAPIFDDGSDVEFYLQERDTTGTPVTANTLVGIPLRAVDPDVSQTVRYSLPKSI